MNKINENGEEVHTAKPRFNLGDEPNLKANLSSKQERALRRLEEVRLEMEKLEQEKLDALDTTRRIEQFESERDSLLLQLDKVQVGLQDEELKATKTVADLKLTSELVRASIKELKELEANSWKMAEAKERLAEACRQVENGKDITGTARQQLAQLGQVSEVSAVLSDPSRSPVFVERTGTLIEELKHAVVVTLPVTIAIIVAAIIIVLFR